MSILSIVSEVDYKSVLEKAVSDLGELTLQREELDGKIAKLHRFIEATRNMLSDTDKELFNKQAAEILKRVDIGTAGLKEAVVMVLKRNQGHWLSVAEVRDKLNEAGFDFSGYVSNSLASVSTTLARLKPDEAEKGSREGVAVYRFNKPEQVHKGKIAAGRLKPSSIPK